MKKKTKNLLMLIICLLMTIFINVQEVNNGRNIYGVIGYTVSFVLIGFFISRWHSKTKVNK